MNAALADLIKISHASGKNPKFVQGGGGNASVKTGDGKYMYIKASGTALKDMTAGKGWRRLRVKAVLSVLKDSSLDRISPHVREPKVVGRLLRACDDNIKTGARPSVEANLHAILDEFVIHLHPNAAGAYVNAKDGRAKLEKIFKNEKLPILWVPYTDPGFMLAKKISWLVDKYKKDHGVKPSIIFLEKHGLFVTAHSASAALKLIRRVINLCDKNLKWPKRRKTKNIAAKAVDEAKRCIDKALLETTGRHGLITHYYDSDIASFMADPNAKKMLICGALAPDEFIYTGGAAVWIDKLDIAAIVAKIKSETAKRLKAPAAFLVAGVGLFVAADKKAAPVIRDIVVSSFYIRANAWRMGGIRGLNKRQQNFINQWEAEAFRMDVAKGKA